MTSNEVSIVFGAVDKTSGVLSGIKSQLIAITGISVSVAAAFKLVKDSLAAAGEQERAIRRLETALIATRGASGMTRDELVNLADSLRRVTTYGDDAIVEAEALMLTFRQVSKETFPAAIGAALDLSTALGQDLQSSIIQIGKALNDPIVGVTALRRVGVSFTQDQRDMIKVLVDSGRAMEAQRIILDELAAEFGGQAQAELKNFSGQIKQGKINVGEIHETIGLFMQDALRPMVTAWNEATLGASDFFAELRMSDIDKAIADLERLGAAAALIKELKAVREVEEQVDALPKAIEGATDAYKELTPWVIKETVAQEHAAAAIKESESAMHEASTALEEYARAENNALTVDLARAIDGVSQKAANLKRDLDLEMMADPAKTMRKNFADVGLDLDHIRQSILDVRAAGDPLDPKNVTLAKIAMAELTRATITLGTQVSELRKTHPGLFERVRDELTDYRKVLSEYQGQLSVYKTQLDALKKAEEELSKIRGGETEIEVQVKARADIDFEKLLRVPDNLPPLGIAIPIEPYQDLFDQLNEIQAEYVAEQQKAADEINGIWESEVLSEEEQLALWYERKIEMAGNNAQTLERIEEIAAERRKHIRAKGEKDELKNSLIFTNAMVDLGRSMGKEGFEAYKLASSAEAMISAHLAAVKALASVKYPFNIIAAAAIYATAMLEVHAIQKQEYGQAHGGLENVPEDATYALKAGERVLAPDQNKLLMELIQQLASEWKEITAARPDLDEYLQGHLIPGAVKKTIPYIEPSAENLAAVEAAFGGGFAATKAWQAILKKSSEYVRASMSNEEVDKARKTWESAQKGGLGEVMMGTRGVYTVEGYWKEFYKQHPSELATSGPIYPAARAEAAPVAVKSQGQAAPTALSLAGLLQEPPMSQDRAGGGRESAVIRTGRSGSLAINEVNINVPAADGLRRMSTADWLSVIQGPLGQAITEASRRGMLAVQ